MRRLLALVALAGALVLLALAVRARLQRASSPRWSRVTSEELQVGEARVAVTEIAWGIALCAERNGKLPPSSGRVPRSLDQVAEKVYQSRFSDWDDPGFGCTAFHMLRPQRFQYRWERTSDDEGVVVAEADLDGDGRVDRAVRLALECRREEPALRCRVDRMVTEPFVPAMGPSWWE